MDAYMAWSRCATGALALGLLCSQAAAQSAPSTGSAAATLAANCGLPVRYQVLEIADGDKKLPVALWSPAPADAASRPWPLIVFAHGYSGGGTGSSELARSVASCGFIWAAPDLSDEVTEVRIQSQPTGNIRAALKQLTARPPTLENYGYRIRELRVTLEAVLRAPPVSVDTNRIALAGHSLGAWTAVNLAVGEPRVRALILYSMGELNYLYRHERFFEPEQLARLKVPSYLTYGSREKQALGAGQSTNSEYSFQHIGGPACLAPVAAGNHFVYVDRAHASGGGSDDQLQRIALGTVSFLRHYLLGFETPVAATACRGENPSR